jgi:lysophospholipase L1-like esterase
MADAGVKHVVYFFYPHLPVNGLLTGPQVNEMLDYAYSRIPGEACNAGSPVPCTFVDLRPPFEGKMNVIQGDGVHPNAAGSEIIGNTLWDALVTACIAQ